MALYTTSDEFIAYMNSPQRTFLKIIPDAECPLIKKIHPRKQRLVEYIYRLVRYNYSDVIRRVIIFGSSITRECYWGSDLDVCIDWNPDFYKESDFIMTGRVLDARIAIGSLIDGNGDILCYREDDDRGVYKDIREKGVDIYG